MCIHFSGLFRKYVRRSFFHSRWLVFVHFLAIGKQKYKFFLFMFRWKIGEKFPQFKKTPHYFSFRMSAQKTTETTVALSGAVYKLHDLRSSENAARDFASAKKTYKKYSKNISLKFPSISLPLRLRSKILVQILLFTKFRVFIFFSFLLFKTTRKTLRAARKKKHSHMFSFVDWWKQRARKKGKLAWNLAKCCEKKRRFFVCRRRRKRRTFSQLLMQLIIRFH